MEEAARAKREGHARDETTRELLIEGCLWLGSVDLLPVLTLLDPARDPPDRKAEAALMLALGQDPANIATLQRWGLR
jgi:hypothetical protein